MSISIPQVGDIWQRRYLNGESNHYLLLESIHDGYNDDVIGWHILQLETGIDTVNIIGNTKLWKKIA